MRRLLVILTTLAAITLLQSALFFKTASALGCISLEDCPGGVCSYTLNFTSPLANASMTTGLTRGLSDDISDFFGVPQQCSLYQRMSVCLGNAQLFDVRMDKDSFSASDGANCSVLDMNVVVNQNDFQVLHASMVAPPCLFSSSGCDCTPLLKSNWNIYDIITMTDAQGEPIQFAPRTACRKKNSTISSHVIYTLGCPLPKGEWAAANVTITFLPNPEFCNPKALTGGAYMVYICFSVLGAVAIVGSLLLVVEGVAKLLMRAGLGDGVTKVSTAIAGGLGHLFDVHGVLHMDMAEGRDRFFTINVMVSVVLGIAIVVFPPKLKSDDNVLFGEPNAKLSDLDLDRIVNTITQSAEARKFYRSLLRPLMTLFLSGCFGLWAYLILLINFTTPPPWTRQGRAEDPGAKFTAGWRAKYVCKKLVAFLSLLMLDVIAWAFVTVQSTQQKRWMYNLPNFWISVATCVMSVAMHCKFVEVVFLELSNGGMFSCLCCCFCCFTSIKTRFYPSPGIKYRTIATARPLITPANSTAIPATTAPKPISSPDATYGQGAAETEEEEQSACTGMLCKAKSMLVDNNRSKNFRYSGWFLAAVAVAVVLAIYYYLLNMEMIGSFAACIALDSPCASSVERTWLPMVLSGVSALLSRDNPEASLTRLVSQWLGTKLEDVMAQAGLDSLSALGQDVANPNSPLRQMYQAVRKCDTQLFNQLIDPAATSIANSTLLNSNNTVMAVASQFGFNVPSLIKPMLLAQVEPIWAASCPKATRLQNQAFKFVNPTMTAKDKVFREVDKAQNFLKKIQSAFLIGGYVGASIGFLVAMASLYTIVRVYRSALMKIHMGRLKAAVIIEEAENKPDDEAVEMLVLTEAARDAQPLRAVFFYGVIFSSVLLQMQLATGILTLAIMLLQLPWFWSVIMVQAAAYLVTMLVGVLISAIVVTFLGSRLAPNGRITSPAGWLVYYIIFSCAYIVLGIFIAVARLVFVILSSLAYIVRIDKCINLIGKQLDPAYMSFLGMMRMHFELRNSAARNRRYHGAWGKVRRVVFERRHLLQAELKRREMSFKKTKEGDA